MSTPVGSCGWTLSGLPVRLIVIGRAGKFDQGKQNHQNDLIKRQTNERNQRHPFCTLATRHIAGRGQREPERTRHEQDDD